MSFVIKVKDQYVKRTCTLVGGWPLRSLTVTDVGEARRFTRKSDADNFAKALKGLRNWFFINDLRPGYATPQWASTFTNKDVQVEEI